MKSGLMKSEASIHRLIAFLKTINLWKAGYFFNPQTIIS